MDSATAPAAPTPNPQPPTAEQAARICTEAWKDPDWGMFVWLAMTTGARRGELCALAWDRIDFGTGIVTIRSSIAQDAGRTWKKDVKTHQQRRIALDEPTVELLRLYRARRAQQAAELDIELADDSRVFSRDPDGRSWPIPGSVSQRYERMCARLGWDLNIKELRHHSATELLAAGVDLRTIAGRLGHSGGGVTTLRVYSAWRPEADEGARPPLPSGLTASGSAVPYPSAASEQHAGPYQAIAADLRGAIACGVLPVGAPIPTLKAVTADRGS